MIKKLLVVLLSIGAFSASVQAALITELASYSLITTTTGTAGGVSSTSTIQTLDPFDSSLGQLDAVEVSIIGNTAFVGNTGQATFIGGIGGNIVGIPYTITTDVSLGFDGLTDYFSTNGDLTGTHIIQATGLGESLSGVGSYNLGFTIDATSELLGNNRPPASFGYSGTGSLASIPLISGDLSDFLDSTILSDMFMFSLDVSFTSTPGSFSPSVITTSATGLMRVDYYYTPQSVPVPATLWLFGTALIGLVGFNRRRKLA